MIEQIRRVAGKSWQYYFYRTQRGAEADLVLVSPSGKRVCIEIKRAASAALSRGFYETLADIKPDHAFVIVPEVEAYPKKDGVWVCGLSEFLRERLWVAA